MLGGMAVGAGTFNLWRRASDTVTGDDPFSKHSRLQLEKHRFSGMHDPYVADFSTRERNFFEVHFPSFRHLLPFSAQDLAEQVQLKSPVRLRHLADCPVDRSSPLEKRGTVVVGGPPALISTAFEESITYINDGRQRPIAFSSAFHLEWDAESEARTSAQPLHFMIDQVARLFFPEQLATAQKTGRFSWKSLDWVSWISHPAQWGAGIRIAVAFQRFAQSGDRSEVVRPLAEQTKQDQCFYQRLDEELDHQLLMPGEGEGSIYAATTLEEKEGLLCMQKGLTQESRNFPSLSESDLLKAFGYLPEGEAFHRKEHDRILSPHFWTLLTDRISQRGGEVINGVVTAIYTDDPEQGGILEYRIKGVNGLHYLQFDKLVMSLGAQQVLGVDGAPLFDIVAARGVSALALVHLPRGSKLPPEVVCGGTNHVTKLAGPVPLFVNDVFLVRMTCGACITPTSDSASYDGGAALGLRTSTGQVLKGRVEMLSVQGCNRQMSRHGEAQVLAVTKSLKAAAEWFTPRGEQEDIGSSLPNKPGIFLIYGLGGGGLTRAPFSAIQKILTGSQ